ncbi:HPP family protein [Halobacterium zhouii]|uniref:HPP family protein n=1 Tax=Halobacterium zhouii TaxID=2902624 RepID=UPI001E4A3E2A|nr:HPP family protein [Halobacterium zhouii]
MLAELKRRLVAARRRVYRLERREAEQLRKWLETTNNLTHLSVLLFVPLLIALVTLLASTLGVVSFLLFPPLASGTYTLFSDPEGRYSDPRKFVGGMTLGALCGWASVEFTAAYVYGVPPAELGAHAGAAALSVLLTGIVAWTVDLELPTAFSTALLVLITGAGQLAYVVSVALSTSLVALVFVVWHHEFYSQRARFLYQTTRADDHVIVPMRGDRAAETSMFGARIAAAHDAGKVVLLDVVDDEDVAAVERDAISDATRERLDQDRTRESEAENEAEQQAADATALELEGQADAIETRIGVPCDVVVAVADGDPADTVLATAEETNSDLVVTPFEANGSGLSPFVRSLFRSDMDAIAFRSTGGRTRWKRVMVPVRTASDVAHAMVDYARRLVGQTGSLSVCSCIDVERDRRTTESMLADLTETVDARCETRVSRSSVESFLERNDAHYDVVFLGASTDRSAASRFISRPTFERVRDLETDIAVVHLG